MTVRDLKMRIKDCWLRWPIKDPYAGYKRCELAHVSPQIAWMDGFLYAQKLIARELDKQDDDRLFCDHGKKDQDRHDQGFPKQDER